MMPPRYRLWFIDRNETENVVSVHTKTEARREAKELVLSGEAEEVAVLGPKGLVWYVQGGVSDRSRDVGGVEVSFFVRWPEHGILSPAHTPYYGTSSS